MPEREFKIKHTTEGADKAKADIEGVAKAEGKLKAQTDEMGGASKKLSGATEDLSIKKENLTNILNRIHPSLGAPR